MGDEGPQTIGNSIAPSSETTHHLAEFSKSARLTGSHNERTPHATDLHMKEKFCKDSIFIPPFLPGSDKKDKTGIVGSLPNLPRGSFSANYADSPPTDTWHLSFHPDGNSHSFHLDGSSIRQTIHLLRILHSRRLSPDGRGGRFNFPGQTCPDPPITLIRRTSAANDSDSPDSLARQTLMTRRIHFHMESRKQL